MAWPGELALRPALPGLAVEADLGLAMLTVLMGTMVVTGLYDITLVGGAPLWMGLGLALQWQPRPGWRWTGRREKGSVQSTRF
jgi:hypothetical protein